MHKAEYELTLAQFVLSINYWLESRAWHHLNQGMTVFLFHM